MIQRDKLAHAFIDTFDLQIRSSDQSKTVELYPYKQRALATKTKLFQISPMPAERNILLLLPNNYRNDILQAARSFV